MKKTSFFSLLFLSLSFSLFFLIGTVYAASIEVFWNTPSASTTVNPGGSGNWTLFHSTNFSFVSGSTLSWSETATLPATIGGSADRLWKSAASDSDGSNLITGVENGRLYTSSDSGSSWTERQPAGDANKEWNSVSSDSDGSYLIAGVKNGRLYTSSDSGASWTERQPAGTVDKSWKSVSSDSDGSNLIAGVESGRLYTSSNSGVSWTERQPAGTADKYWNSVSSDSDGSNLIASAWGGRLYTSSDSGVSWTERNNGEVGSVPITAGVAVIKLVYSSEVWGGVYYSGATIYNRVSVQPDGDGHFHINMSGTISATGCTNVYSTPVSFYIESESPYSTVNCPEGFIRSDGICITGTESHILYPTNCPVDEGYILQDGICLQGTISSTLHSTACPVGEGYILQDGICLKGTISSTLYSTACPVGEGYILQDGICLKGTLSSILYTTASCPADSVLQDGICINSTITYRCGDNVKAETEECDGTDSVDCPGLCIPAGQVDQCKCPPKIPPTATLLDVEQSYCLKSLGLGNVSLQWLYEDIDGDHETEFNLQIDNNSDFSSIESYANYTDIDNPSPTTNVQSVPVRTVLTGNDLAYNTTYYWRVKVHSTNLDSGWVTGPSFTTTLHYYPYPAFAFLPLNPIIGDEITFTSVSQCTPPCICTWDFGDGNFAAGDIVKNIYTAAGTYKITLTVSDGINICYGDEVGVIIRTVIGTPEWKEISPF